MSKSYFPALLWLLVVTGASVMPSVQLPTFELLAPDKFGHAFSYCVLTVLIMRAGAQAPSKPPPGPLRLPPRGRPPKGESSSAQGGEAPNPKASSPRPPGWTAAVFSMAWGVLMEYVQYFFLPGRFYEYDDMLANGVGALIGWGGMALLNKYG